MQVNFESVLPVISAIVLATAGWLKTQPHENFDKAKFVRTIIIGVCIGVASVFLNVSVNQSEELVALYLIDTGAIEVLERAVLIVWRRILDEPYKFGG